MTESTGMRHVVAILTFTDHDFAFVSLVTEYDMSPTLAPGLLLTVRDDPSTTYISFTVER